MPGNSPSVAFHEFIEPIRRTVSCLTQEPVIVSPGGRRDMRDLNALTLAGGEPIVLTEAGDGVTFDLGLQYVIVENPDPTGKKYKVRTRGYQYTFSDFDGNQICAYHWHPLGDDGFPDPHIHVSGTKPHYATPRVSIESMVRTAITEFGAKTLRDDWDKVLSLNHMVFALYSTWHDESDRPKADAMYEPKGKAKKKQKTK